MNEEFQKRVENVQILLDDEIITIEGMLALQEKTAHLLERSYEQLASMTEERNQWERTAHGSLEAIERIAATLDIPTTRPDSALGVSYPELEKAIIEAIKFYRDYMKDNDE